LVEPLDELVTLAEQHTDRLGPCVPKCLTDAGANLWQLGSTELIDAPLEVRHRCDPIELPILGALHTKAELLARVVDAIEHVLESCARLGTLQTRRVEQTDGG